MTLPRMRFKRSVILVAVIAIGIVLLRPIVGGYCRRQAFSYGAAANSAMMDVAGFGEEARSALKDGDRERYLSVSQQLADARTQEADYESRRRKHEKIASLLGLEVMDFVPPGVPIPRPNYGPSR